MNRTTSNKKAFTLVELLVVIGIIALLISILLPSLNKARVAAKRVECASLIRQGLTAARMYAGDNKDFLPPFRNNDFGGNLNSVFNYAYTLDDTGTPNMGVCLGRVLV